MGILPAGGQARGWRAVLFQLGRERCFAPPLDGALAGGVSRDGGGGRVQHHAARLHVHVPVRRAHAHVGALRAVLDQHSPVHGPAQRVNLQPSPSIFNLQPSTLNPRSSNFNLQPPTLSPKPSTLNPQPSRFRPTHPSGTSSGRATRRSRERTREREREREFFIDNRLVQVHHID